MKSKSLLCGLLMILSACGGYNFNVSNNTTGEQSYVFSEFGDIPVPENSMMDLEKTEIYGKDEEWVGKLIFESPYDPIGLFEFYKTELPKFSWVEVAATHGISPVLVYGRWPRILLIKIEPQRFEGSLVTLTMTPAPKRKDKMKRNTTTNTNTTTTITTDTNTKVETMPITQSSIFVSPDAQKQVAGSLGLGEASNVNYKSNSNGVGAPPKFN